MAQVFIWGAYKKPRETTWMLGVVLMLLTLAFGLTGYLLPWDNRAYWGTVVTTRIAAQARRLPSPGLHACWAGRAILVSSLSPAFMLCTLCCCRR